MSIAAVHVLAMQDADAGSAFWQEQPAEVADHAESDVSTSPQVLVTVPRQFSGNNLPEWCLIELQGSLIPTKAIPGMRADEVVDVSGKLIGRVAMEERRGKQTPILYVGSHILDGRAVKLNPPILITEKMDGVDGDERVAAHYEVVGVAREKFLFKNRPRFNLG